MDEDNKDQNETPQEQEEQKSPFDNTGQVGQQAKRVGKKAIGALRGVGAAGEAAEAGATAAEAGAGIAAGAESGAAAAGAVAGEAGAAAGAAATEAAVGAVAATGSSLGSWALVAVVIVVFIMTILIAVLGGQQTTVASNAVPPPPSSTGSGTVLPPPPPSVECQYIDSIIRGAPYYASFSGNFTCAQKQFVYTALNKFFSYPGIRNKMGQGSLVFEIDDSFSTDCAAYVPPSSTSRVRLSRFSEAYCNSNILKYIVEHEFFHILHNRVPSLLQEYPYSEYISSERQCYKYWPDRSVQQNFWVIRTYIHQNPSSDIRESFAESGALYINNSSPINSSLSDFSGSCPKNWNWWNLHVR